MRKHSLTLFFFQLLASAMVMVAEANTGSRGLGKTRDEPAEVKDLEMETSQEKDVFPDLMTFAIHIYQ
ncbi:MAG TPA: hypothetical protein VFH08_12415 [Chitinophagaceae bacterium]|nr:hypothetical protein [Chitinophagaceae bacterium]